MSKKKGKKINGENGLEINMTPMIDIVFQLLIFFVLTAKFIEHEGELLSYLPKDRGLNAGPAQVDANPLTIFLQWKGEMASGECIAITNNYQPAEGGNVRYYQFPQIEGAHGKGTGYPANYNVNYDYPNFVDIKNYMAYRKNRVSGTGRDLKVTINFADGVPVQMVVNMLDICQELKITDFAINAQSVLD